MLFSYIKWPKLIIAAIYEKLSETAKKTNTTVKSFLGDDKNIEHISLVIYDILPLAIKLGYRYEQFKEQFTKHFSSIRNKIYSYEEELQATKEENISPPIKKTRTRKPKTNANDSVQKKPKTVRKKTTRKPKISDTPLK